jgi:hypothetical protein
MIGPADPLEAIDGALRKQRYDEVILSTLPERVSEWLHRDLHSRIEARGLPVTVVKAKSRTHPPQPARTH